MNSILNEVAMLRKDKSLVIDRSNKNRYRLVMQEIDGTKNAYYFSIPIYNESFRNLLDLKFHNQGNTSKLIGSNSNIVLGNTILLENYQGNCQITMPKGYRFQNEHCISYQGAEVYPTTNGIALQVDLDMKKQYRFRLKTGRSFYQIRNNNKYFSLMSEKHKPFLTVSCIGSLYQNRDLFAPAEIKYQKISDKEYEITVYSSSPHAKKILFEINLQEQKLFQDTTVESKHPKQNNAFGGTAFIGSSASFGEQWLYARPDFSILNDLLGKSIHKVYLYIPLLHRNDMKLMTVALSTRFCSFGSTWDNKKAGSQKTNLSEIVSGYHKIDITEMITHNQRLLTTSEGWIIKSAVKSSGFSAISTGDSFYAPQILEVIFQ